MITAHDIECSIMSTDSAFPLQESSHARPLLTLAIATSTITTSLMAFAAFARLAAKAFVVKRIHLEDCESPSNRAIQMR